MTVALRVEGKSRPFLGPILASTTKGWNGDVMRRKEVTYLLEEEMVLPLGH